VPGFKRVAPIFPVRDVEAALAHYRRLGFETRGYEDGMYGFAARDSLEIHLGLASALDPGTNASGAYLWVDDADALAAEWRDAGVEVATPVDTPWGQHEGAHRDPDGNVIRFGSPVTGGDPG
jgi:catechol 2,3-dioxygenase-like lactoylglutathione lyase family enzyme